MKRVVGRCATVVLALHLAGYAQTWDTSAGDCDLLKASPTSLTMEEAVRRATKKVMPEILGDMTTRDSRVTVVVVVNKNGSVECVHVKEGHPLLIGQCIEAARRWKFRPYTVKGHSVPFITNLTFHFRDHDGRIG